MARILLCRGPELCSSYPDPTLPAVPPLPERVREREGEGRGGEREGRERERGGRASEREGGEQKRGNWRAQERETIKSKMTVELIALKQRRAEVVPERQSKGPTFLSSWATNTEA